MPRRVEEQAIRAVNGRQTSRTEGKFRCGCAGETAQTPGWRPPTQTPGLVGRQRSSAPSSLCSRPPPLIPRGSRALRCGSADHRNDPPGRALRSRSARSKSCHASCRPPPRPNVSRSVTQPPKVPGEASRWPSRKVATSLGRSPPLIRRSAWRGERKVFPSVLGGCARLCCADAANAHDG
jgi:hypothetical protein